MTSFSQALALQTTRLAAANSYIAPLNNPAAQQALVGAQKVNAFLAPYARRANRIPGFTSLHPAFFHQLYSTLVALEHGASLARARGDGRLASSVDQVRSIGNGFAKAVPAIERFLGIDQEPTGLIHVNKRNLNAVFPQMDALRRSGELFTRVIDKISARRLLIEGYQTEGIKISDEDRRSKLIYGKWNEARIIEYSIEYLARTFALAMPNGARERLIHEDTSGFSLKQAMDQLVFAPAAF